MEGRERKLIILIALVLFRVIGLRPSRDMTRDPCSSPATSVGRGQQDLDMEAVTSWINLLRFYDLYPCDAFVHMLLLGNMSMVHHYLAEKIQLFSSQAWLANKGFRVQILYLFLNLTLGAQGQTLHRLSLLHYWSIALTSWLCSWPRIPLFHGKLWDCHIEQMLI